MGDRLQIHPITILIVLLVMGDLMGIVGVFARVLEDAGVFKRDEKGQAAFERFTAIL